jgi:hypothetical protein
MPFTGQAAVDPTKEIDLLIDEPGDKLEVDPQGDVLVVTPGETWTGQTASETV